jgi:DNA-directed RNA polymerase specialized sigma24 family protein
MARFATTRWTLIEEAASSSTSAAAREALQELCKLYWYPLYAFVRRAYPRFNGDDAADATQEFFALILARDDLGGVDRRKGRFRSWLLASMRHFLANEHDKRTALKRGGGAVHVPLDTVAFVDRAEAEARFAREPVDALDAEKLYARRFALVAVKRAMAKLRAEFAGDDVEKQRLFDAVKGSLVGEPPDGGYAALAAKLGTTAGALRTQSSRLRELLRAEVAETLAVDADVDQEIAELLESLA